MQASDVFYITYSLGFIVLVGCAVFVTYYVIKMLKTFQKVADRVEDTTHDMSVVKDSIKYGVVSLFSALLGKIGERR